MNYFDLGYFLSIFPGLIAKIPITLWLSTLAFIIALLLGIVLSIMKNCKNKIIKGITTVYISFFRATPYITQLFILYFGLPQIFPTLVKIKAPIVLIVSIALNSSAFIAEIVRGSLLSVDKGQTEAALSIGLTEFQIMKDIVLPQAFVSAIPAFGNAYVNMIKGTAMGFTIGVVELLSQAKIGSSSSYRFLESYVAAGIIYWIIIIVIDYLQKKLELKAGDFK